MAAIKCWNCEEYAEESEVVEVEGELICMDCVHTAECDWCGENFEDESDMHIRGSRLYHLECRGYVIAEMYAEMRGEAAYEEMRLERDK